MLFLLILCHLSGPSVQASPNETASSLPYDSTGTDSRTIWSIVFSCTATILLSLWISIRPNIPAPFPERDTRFWKTPLFRRLLLLLIALIYPELVLACAVSQRLAVKELVEDTRWTTTQAYFAIMGGFHLYQHLDEPLHPLDKYRVKQLVTDGILELPTDSEIQDQSQSEMVVRILAIIQAGWFVMHCVTRVTHSLPLTKLEIITVTYVAMASMIYLVWLDKPRNINHPVRVHMEQTGEPLPTDRWRYQKVDLGDYVDLLIGEGDCIYDLQKYRRVPLLYGGSRLDFDYVPGGVGLLMGAVSSGINCIAWSYVSLSFAELVLWRIASLSIGMVVLFLLLAFNFRARRRSANIYEEYINIGLALLTIVLYIVARILLFILGFISLRSLTPDMYSTIHWTSFIPHI